ncbi:MAG: hypothetical protein R2733_20970 [Acidimicrobiales bacterium]
MTPTTPPSPDPDRTDIAPGVDPASDAARAPGADGTDGIEPERVADGATSSTRPVSAAPVRPAIIGASIVVTVLHSIVTLAGVLSDADIVRNGVAVFSVVCFFVGAVAFGAAFVLAAGRSRYEELWFGGAFFLTGGVVPALARNRLAACLAVQCVVGLAGASLAPFTPVAFTVLVPLAGMGLMSLYGARWGEFSPKQEAD